MSTWNFKRESTHPAAGSNTNAGTLAGFQPFAEADNLASKRNVIATEKGWVRRQTYTDVHGNSRIKDEVLVAAHPADGYSYASNNYLGNPDIAQVYLGPNTSGASATTFANNVSMNVYVVFNEPVHHNGLAGNLVITVTNTHTTGVGSFTLVANTTTNLVNANNTLVFVGTVAGGAGTYKIGAQTLAAQSTAANLVSLNTGLESANLVLTGAVSNTLGTFTVV